MGRGRAGLALAALVALALAPGARAEEGPAWSAADIEAISEGAAGTAGSDKCKIYICLPGAFLPGECRGALREMSRRIFAGKSPVPSWSSCFSGDPEVTVHTAVAARMPDDPVTGARVYVLGRRCVVTEHNDGFGEGESRTPRGCLATYRVIAMTDRSGARLGEPYYQRM